MVQHIGPDSIFQDPQHIELLWVQWYGRDPESQGGWKSQRLHQIGFVEGEDDAAFGFLDPADIIRGVHLIPSFTDGRTRDLLPSSECARSPEENDEDYRLFNIGMAITPDNTSDDNKEAAAQLNGVTFEEEEDYGYNDPMGQETDEENDVDADEWDKGVELDILGPKDGDEGTQSM
ncbi:hypothetical protein C0991_002527 [Blastosporella zonata]|nr:hypothetical protein C0991_002527 [Blastosporella zonata]